MAEREWPAAAQQLLRNYAGKSTFLLMIEEHIGVYRYLVMILGVNYHMFEKDYL